MLITFKHLLLLWPSTWHTPHFCLGWLSLQSILFLILVDIGLPLSLNISGSGYNFGLTTSRHSDLSLAHKNHVNKWQVILVNYNKGRYTSLHWYVPWYKLQLHVNKGSYRFPICHKYTCYLVTSLHDYGLPLQSFVDCRLCKLEIHCSTGEMASHNVFGLSHNLLHRSPWHNYWTLDHVQYHPIF